LGDYDSALEIIQMAMENVDNTDYFAEPIIEVNELVNQQQLAINEKDKGDETKKEQKVKSDDIDEKVSEVNSESSNATIENIGEVNQFEDDNVSQNTTDNSSKTEGVNGSLEDAFESIAEPQLGCDIFINSPSELSYRESPHGEEWSVHVEMYSNENKEFEYVYLQMAYLGENNIRYFMTYNTFQNWLDGYKIWILENDKDYNPYFIGRLAKNRVAYVLTETRNVNGKIYNIYDMEGYTAYNHSVDGYVW
jgi:hypothetical protein